MYIDGNKDLKGHWVLEAFKGDIVRDAEGSVSNEKVWHWEGDNMIVNQGKNQIMNMLFGLSSATKINGSSVGTSATAAALTDTQLGGGSVLLQAFDALPTSDGAASPTVTTITTYGTGVANFSWNELGLFNGTTNGTSKMLNRIAPIGPFTKTSAVSIIVTVTIQQS